ncbi:MAG: gamma-glutamyl-gamma-aminobutyrate hydrolase family protein [Actinomycetales bacterium]|nr:gamma-glutamyl-gamma-aminobutyrate hydrolase family protein [Actinomycetales bacterium]
MSRTPIVAIPGRFSSSASAHRYRAVTTARALSELVLAAGGEPVTVHPVAPGGQVTPAEAGARLGFADAVLLPGGGDLSPARYGQDVAHDDVYDVDDEQDAFDLAVARWALDSGTPLLAVCRGMQVVNVALGGDLEQHMGEPHRHVVHPVAVDAGTTLAAAVGPTVQASCYHHQRVLHLGAGLVPVARAADGCVEALVRPDARGWFLAVQWHPEDTFGTDPAQVAVVRLLVDAACS